MPKILNEREQAFITELKALIEKFGVDFETDRHSSDIAIYAGANYDAESDTYGNSIVVPDINVYLYDHNN